MTELERVGPLSCSDIHTRFRKDLEELINRYSVENGSNTPDFLLSIFLCGCLATFDAVVRRRDQWYGFKDGLHPRMMPRERKV